MVVQEIMSESPFAVQVTEATGTVMAKLREADVRHLPVLDGDMVVGVVSDRDLRNLELPALVELENLGQAQELARRAIGDVMSSNVISVSPETEVSEAIDLMIEQKIGAVVVVEADSDKLVGIVSYIDVLRAARDLL